MTWKFENQGPTKDWPSVTRADGTLLVRTYGPDAEGVARQIAALPSMQDAARAMLAALRAALDEIHNPGAWPCAEPSAGVADITDYLARVIAQARAAGITTDA